MTDVLKTDVVAEPRRPEIDPELVEQLMADAGDEVELLSPDGLLSSLTKAVMERAVKAELSHEPRLPRRGSGWARVGELAQRVIPEDGDHRAGLDRGGHLALDGDLATAEPKRLRYGLFHTAGHLITTGRRRVCRLSNTWPWTDELIAAFTRVHTLPLRI